MRPVLSIVLVLLLAPASALGSQAFRCQFDGAVRPSCCCRGETSEEREAEKGGSFERSGCCDIVNTLATEGSAARLATESLRLKVPPSIVLAILAAPPEPPRAAAALAQRDIGPPSTGDPLFLQHCSLLL